MINVKHDYIVRGKSRFTGASTKKEIILELFFIDYYIIFHMNNYKHIFASHCTLKILCTYMLSLREVKALV